MEVTLYRKYRPKSFKDVKGQEDVTRTLRGALLSGQVGHAYLFCGPRGTGKTTIARLFAKALNCEKRHENTFEPCNVCDSCVAINEGRSLDLIEIDAASNRGIDEIRNIKESASVASSSSTYKVFIIDEVHMLTPPAFNALLKILEEPPTHVIFILATTEAHKIIGTVLSRVQRLDLKKILPSEIGEKLQDIAKKEGVSIDEEAIFNLAAYAGGSLRDAESAFTKLISFAGKKITGDDAAQILGIVPSHFHSQFLQSIIGNNPQEAITQINNLYESGADLENFTKQFIAHVRLLLISSVSNTRPESIEIKPEALVKILNTFIGVKNELKVSPIPQLPIELAIMELTSQSPDGGKK